MNTGFKIEAVKTDCTHEKLEKEQPDYVGTVVKVVIYDKTMPESIMYSPYICKNCSKRYIVLQAVVVEP